MDKRLRFMTGVIEPLVVERRVPPSGSAVITIRAIRARCPVSCTAPGLLADGVALTADFQDRLAAQDTFGVLPGLAGIDAAGKDGTIEHRDQRCQPAGGGGPGVQAAP